MGANVIATIEGGKQYDVEIGDLFFSEANDEYYIVAACGVNRKGVQLCILCCLNDGAQRDDAGSIDVMKEQLKELDAVPFKGTLSLRVQ